MDRVQVALVGDDGEPGTEIGDARLDSWSNDDGWVVGGGSVTFSIVGVDADRVDALKAKSELCILVDGEPVQNSYIELNDPVKESLNQATGLPDSITYGFNDVRIRFEDAILAPSGAAAQERHFTGTPGAIMDDLLDEAWARGALDEITKDFTASLDSNGVAWPASSLLDFYMKPTSTYGDVMRVITGERAAEAFVRKRNFRMFVWDTKNMNGELEVPPLILAAGRDIESGVRKADSRGLGNAVYVFGDDERFAVDTDSGSITEYRRRERTLSASGVSSQDRLDKIAEIAAGQYSVPIAFRTYTLVLRQGENWTAPHPYGGYFPGDRIGVEDDTASGTVWGKVAQITVSVDALGDIKVTLALDSRRATREERIADRLDWMMRGTPGAVPADQARIAPAPPTTLTFTTGTDVPGKGPETAWLQPAWTNPTLDADGEPLVDLDRLEVQWRIGTGKWRTVNAEVATNAKIPGLPLGTSVDVRVYAVDTSENRSTALVGSSTTAAGTGRYAATNTAGTAIFQVDAAETRVREQWSTTQRVPGAQGSDYTQQFLRGFDTGGFTSIELDFTTGDTEFSGNVIVQGNVSVGGDFFVDADTVMDGTLTVDAATTINGTLDVDGAATFSSTLGITGATTIGGTLGVSGATTFTGSLTVSGTTSLAGTLSLDAPLDATGQTITGANLVGVTVSALLVNSDEVITDSLFCDAFGLGITPRGAFAVSGNATDLPTVITLANDLRGLVLAFGLS